LEKKMGIDINETPTEYLFEVSDNGPGIPEENREKIFKKGFTTKKTAGHGFGLSIVSDILRENSGSIDLRSGEGETVFTVSLGKS
jgi:signal transduction histidine kinase